VLQRQTLLRDVQTKGKNCDNANANQGKNPPQREQVSAGTGCSERLWNLHSWMLFEIKLDKAFNNTL